MAKATNTVCNVAAHAVDITGNTVSESTGIVKEILALVAAIIEKGETRIAV